jgi:hypothetical protein
MKYVATIALLAVMSIPRMALAEEAKPATKPIPASWDWAACKDDAEKFCKGVDGADAIYLCLFKHDADLSKACNVVHTKYEEATGRN